MAQQKIESESRLSFMEATSIIVGHGVGSGILSVPYLASRNSWLDIIWVIALCYAINLLMHYMIADLSLNNGGAQFIKCFERELFKGKAGKALTWGAFVFLGLSVLVNVSGFISGSAAVFSSWIGVSPRLGMVIYYVLASLVVLFGMKLVGICENISVYAMVAVVGALLVAVLAGGTSEMPNKFVAPGNILALYSMVAFALSAVMSTPQVVKGLDGDVKKIRASIALGTGINTGLILLITITTLLGAGSQITQNGALVDLASKLGGWVGIVGYIFSLLALSTSFWANTLNLRDIVHEQTGLGLKPSYIACSIPSLLLAIVGLQSFVGFTRIASVIQVLTGVGIIISFHRSRKRTGLSPVTRGFGTIPFEIIVIASSLIATVGALVKVK